MALIIDIETAGENYHEIDESTKSMLHQRTARKDVNLTEDEVAEQTKQGLGLLPFTGQIIAFGVLDSDSDKGAIYYQPGKNNEKTEDSGYEQIKFRPLSEKEILLAFWQAVGRYDTIVTYSGRTFDLPYVYLRCLANGVKAEKDFLRGRYLYQQAPNAKHIDLYDQMSFYGSLTGGPGSLHLVSRALGIDSPKDGLDGAAVGAAWEEGKILDIVKYNLKDLFATREVYRRWRDLIAF